MPTASLKHSAINPVRFDRNKAAEYLCLSVRSVDYLISTRRLKATRQGGKVFIQVADLDRYASQDHTQPIRPATR
ncbi:helix-turn-helix domain-containing protein [Granulicella cerasi]|uniref:Helix-turn-helix domain-containing protein n=1 Tax=Granulicella cerasi TaxID=741063 RepID=A0ABW1Z409_9BACT